MQGCGVDTFRDGQHQEVVEAVARPLERVLFLPVPVVHVGAVATLVYDPALIALPKFGHPCDRCRVCLL